MNFKALIKTIIPAKSEFFRVIGLWFGLMCLVACILGIMFLMIYCISLVMENYHIPNIYMLYGLISISVIVMGSEIISAFMHRYKRIKKELEND